MDVVFMLAIISTTTLGTWFCFGLTTNGTRSPIPAVGCSDDTVECPGTGSCIYHFWICDEVDDCGDNWDETDCYTDVEFDNLTRTLCAKTHFCSALGCSEDNQDTPRLCYCDSACRFFEDCCIDYETECCHDQHDQVQNKLSSRDFVKGHGECITLNQDVSDSYWMVSRCSKDVGVVSERCHEPICNDTLTIIPVTDSFGISYRNVYCAACHNIRTSELIAWEATVTCDEISLYDNEIDADFLCRFCSFDLKPPVAFQSSAIAARKCNPLMISQYDDQLNEFHGTGCGMYTAIIEINGEIYRNPHCFTDVKTLDEPSCSGNIPWYSVQHVKTDPPSLQPTESYNWSYSVDLNTSEEFLVYDKVDFDYSTYFIKPLPAAAPLSIVLDFGSSKSGSSVKIMRNAEIVKETTMTCPEDEVYVEQKGGSGDCVRLSCAEGFNLQDGKCILDTSRIACGSDVSNQTIELTVTLNISRGFCNVDSFTNVSKDVLGNLLGKGFVADDFSEASATCNVALTNTVEIVYTISNAPDLFQLVQDRIQKYDNIELFQSMPEITSTIEEIEITRNCLNSDLKYICDTDWISETNHIVSVRNGSFSLFLNNSSEWMTLDGIIFRVRYQTDNKTNIFKRIYDLKICHVNTYLNCPYIMMNMSSFDNWNSSDEVIRHKPTGHMLNPSEYMITSNDEIMICNFLNQTVVLNVTYTYTFFEYSNPQTIVSIIGSVFSLIAIGLTFLTYAVFASLRNRASRLIMNLVIALFLGQFLLLFGGSRTENENACISIAVLAHYAWLAAFAWMNALAFDLDRTFGNPDNLQQISEGKKSLVLYMMYAWGSPLLIVLPCLGVHFCQCTQINFQYGSTSACWINDGTANLLTFGLPAAIFLIFNVVLFGHTVAGIRTTKKSTARIHKDISKLKRTAEELLVYIKIASLMGFTWIFGYVAAFTGIETLWYIYIILNSLQGFFIFISFICNRRVGMLWSKKLNLSCLLATQKSSTNGAVTRSRTTSAINAGKGTQMTPFSSRQSGYSEPDGSTQPLKSDIQV